MIKWGLIFFIGLSSTCCAGEFYQSRKWLNLLYYEKSGDEYRSVADDDRFFVSKFGKTNPKSEYEAELKLTLDQDPEFRQKFPLRYKTITKVNQLPYIPIVTVNNAIDSVVVAYPNRYMANPASMFGHLFLILKSKQGLMDSDILHYIADTAGQDQSAYIFNGLTGQFKGWFLKEPYYRKIKEYNYVEDREIVYYDLKLSAEQIEDLQLHSVELKQSYFYYYFLDENCAFFMGKLLNVVLDEDILSRSSLIFPSQIINTLYDKNLLISEYRRKPSTKVFNEHFSQLTDDEQSNVIDLILHETNSVPSSPEVLKTFLYTSEYLINTQSQLSPIIRHNRIKAYQKLQSQNNANVRPINTKQNTVSPIKSKGLSATYGFSDQISLSYNPIYYGDYEPFSELEVKKLRCLSPRLILAPTLAPLFEITLADIESITQYNTVLNGYSWRLSSSVGFQTSVVTNQSFEIGQAYRILGEGLAFGFIGLNYSNYDSLTERKLEFLMLRPSLSIGIAQPLISETLNAKIAYDNRFGKNYLTAKISLKAMGLIHQLNYVQTDSISELQLSTTTIF